MPRVAARGARPTCMAPNDTFPKIALDAIKGESRIGACTAPSSMRETTDSGPGSGEAAGTLFQIVAIRGVVVGALNRTSKSIAPATCDAAVIA
jgi:hypothetical protein